MGVELMGFILGIAGFLIVLFLGVIGYFLRALHSTVKTLEVTVSELVMNIEVNKATNEFKTEMCKGKHETIEKQFHNHEKRIQELEKVK